MPCQHEYGEEVDCLLMEGHDPATGRKVWRCWAHKPVPPPRTASDTETRLANLMQGTRWTTA